MGKVEMVLLAFLGLVGFVMLVRLMVKLIKKHGVGVDKGRKPTREEELGYNPSLVSKAAALFAVGSFIGGIFAAIKPFRDDDY